MKTTLLALALFAHAIFQGAIGQTVQVRYKLLYNSQLLQYEAYAIPLNTVTTRTATSQFTIASDNDVVHSITVIDGPSHAIWSLLYNRIDDGSTPNPFSSTGTYSGNRYFLIQTNTAGPETYTAGLPVLLFTFTLPGGCDPSMRIWQNGVDPASTELTGGGDYGLLYNQIDIASGGDIIDGYIDNLTPGHVGCDIPVTGNIWNDLDENKIMGAGEDFINGTNTGAGILTGAPLYINLTDEYGKVIASTTVNTDGSYSFAGVPSGQIGLRLQLSVTPANPGSILQPPVTPAGWVNTGFNADPSNTAPAQDITSPALITLNTGTGAITHQDFGIQQLPESAISVIPPATNPGGTVNFIVPDNNWAQSTDPISHPDTKDYNGGKVDSIRITVFPPNVTSMAINGVTYYPTGSTPPPGGVAFPLDGVTVVAAGGVPATPIAIDPIDGVITIVVYFVSIDNGHREDPTPGSVTFSYNSVLPLVLTSFNAVRQNTGTYITWITASEQGTREFIIERSANGNNYGSIGKVTAAANSSTAKQYSFVDTKPLTGSNFYRLKMVDIDGRFTYSTTRMVSFDGGLAVNIYPNPVSSILTISSLAEGSTYAITAINGQQMATGKILSGTGKVAVNSWSPGSYTIKIIKGGAVIYTTSFLKK